MPGAIFETSLDRAKWLRKIEAIEIIEKTPERDKLPEIVKLRNQRLTYQAIGEKLSVSKVAVHNQLKKKGLTGRGNLVNQIKDLQLRVSNLEKEVGEWTKLKPLMFRR